MKNVQRGLGFITLVLSFAAWTHSVAQTSSAVQIAAASPAPSFPGTVLPDAPDPQQPVQAGSASTFQPTVAQPRVARKYALMIEPGQKAQRLTAPNKFIFSLLEASRPINLAPAIYSAGYEQITGADPKYGSDSGAFAARFGAAMAHSASTRLFADGLFASAFHQDPRYYRVGNGSVVHRGLHSALQALIRRGDDGAQQINYSGIVGRGASAGLILAYYPPISQTTSVVLSTWGISIVSDAGGDLALEFLPDLARKFPILNRFHVE